ncbi:hypothetical protein SESBI_33006 [Sesbania bispinosa]|nr:hypothetical protein SESBI_33006 [Sesbania bispinosa]
MCLNEGDLIGNDAKMVLVNDVDACFKVSNNYASLANESDGDIGPRGRLLGLVWISCSKTQSAGGAELQCPNSECEIDLSIVPASNANLLAEASLCEVPITVAEDIAVVGERIQQ